MWQSVLNQATTPEMDRLVAYSIAAGSPMPSSDSRRIVSRHIPSAPSPLIALVELDDPEPPEDFDDDEVGDDEDEMNVLNDHLYWK